MPPVRLMLFFNFLLQIIINKYLGSRVPERNRTFLELPGLSTSFGKGEHEKN